VKKGAKFEDLAKKYSEDPGTKDKGGDLGWLIQGQTVAEFEKPRSACKRVRFQIGQNAVWLHIIKVLDKETAHTKPFEEVKDSLRAPLLLSQADKQASDIADQMSVAIRKSNKTSLDDLANQYKLISVRHGPSARRIPCSSLAIPRSKGRHLPPARGGAEPPYSHGPRLRRPFPENRPAGAPGHCRGSPR